jgi:GntR family transcriptional regulator
MSHRTRYRGAMTIEAVGPKYAQMAADLRGKIEAGELAPGDPLPSEPELAERYGVSRTSARNGIKLLVAWGLVVVERGRGTFVRRPRTRVRRHATERYRREKSLVRHPEYERRTSGTVEQDAGLALSDITFRAEFDVAPASPEIAGVFGVPEGARLLRRRYLHIPKGDGVPLRAGDSWLLLSDAEKNPDLLRPELEPWPGGTQHQLSTVGIELDRITDSITARPPTPDEMQSLGINEGVSVLVLRKVSIATDERVVEVADVVMPGDRTELIYTVDLPRWGT